MKVLNLKNLIVLAVLIVIAPVFTNAQDTQNRTNIRPQRLFEQLGLSREQIQQIRRIYQEKQPQMREAQEKFRTANRALDAAIYADTINEEEIKNRLKDVQLAQAEVIKIRSLIEFEVRKVLTAEQLAKFRRLREEIERQIEERRLENQDRPNQQRRNNNENFQRRRNNRQNF